MKSKSQYISALVVMWQAVSWCPLVFSLLVLMEEFKADPVYAQETSALTVRVSSESEQREALIKSAYIINFTKYITWPEELHGQSSNGQKLCMISDERFAGIVRKMAGSKAEQGKRSEVMTAGRPEDCGRSSLIYVQSLDPVLSGSVIERVRGKGVLTVGESEHFLEEGGMIRILVVNNTVQFEVNVKAIEDAGLLVSSNMLRVAWRTVK